MDRRRNVAALISGALVALGLLLAPRVAAQAPPGNVLSRENLVAAGTLAAGGGATYTVKYLPLFEAASKPSPWVLRMYYTAPGAIQGSIGFTWLDQTDPTAPAATTNSTGTSTTPQVGGNATDIPPGSDSSNVQQAVLSAGGGGNFVITLFNNSSVTASYVLRLFPLNGGVLEAGLNPFAAPPQPSPPPAPQPAAPTPPPAPAFTPFWVKTLVRGAKLYSNVASPPGITFGELPQFACLLVVQPLAGARFYVQNPASGNYAYVNATDVGGLAPSDRSCG